MDQLLKELADINALFQSRADFSKSLALLRALKAGTVRLDNVLLSASGDGWALVAIEPAQESTPTPEPEVETAGPSGGIGP